MKHFVILGKLQSKYDFRDYNDDVTVISMNKHFDAEFLERVDYWFIASISASTTSPLFFEKIKPCRADPC